MFGLFKKKPLETDANCPDAWQIELNNTRGAPC